MRAIVAGLALAALLCGRPDPLAARPYGLDDLLRQEDIGQILVDPGGRWLAFEKLDGLLAMPQPGRIAISHVLRARPFVVDLQRGGPARALLPDGMTPGTKILGFSPEGTQLAVARLEDDRLQLGLITVATGATDWFPYAPSYDGFHSILAWLSEDRLLLIAEADSNLPWALAMDRAPDRVRDKWDATAMGKRAVTVIGSGRYLRDLDRPAQRLLLLDRRSGTARPLARGHFNQLVLSPHHDRVALLELAQPQQPAAQAVVREDEGFFARTLRLVDLVSGAQWVPCPDCAVQGDPRWDVDGRYIAFLAEDQPGIVARVADIRGRTLWRAGQDRLPARPLRCTLSPQEGVPVAARTSRPSDTDAFRWQVPIDCAKDADVSLPGWRPVAWRNLGDGGAVLVERVGAVPLAHLSPSGIASVDALRQQGRATPLLLRVRARSGETRLLPAGPANGREIMVLNAPMRDVEPAILRRLEHPGPDGARLISWLLLPPCHDSRAALPLVVIPYPGEVYSGTAPADQMVTGLRPYANAQLLAAAGFAVLLPSLPMPDRLPDTGFPFAQALDPAIDAALATGCCDANRMALWGHSFGAYAVAMAATQSARFRAIIASSGIYDLGATVGTFGPAARIAPEQGVWVASSYAWAEAGQGRMGAAPWTAPSRYLANSPVYRADRIQTPMLLIAADRDFAPLGQAEQLFSALFRQGKDAQLVTYWGEGHVVASPANLRDLYERVLAFLEENLGSAKPVAHAGP